LSERRIRFRIDGFVRGCDATPTVGTLTVAGKDDSMKRSENIIVRGGGRLAMEFRASDYSHLARAS
jgi:hypothetical protein